MAAETGLHSLSGDARARVADRPMWIGANIDSFQRLLRPVTDKFGEKMTRAAAEFVHQSGRRHRGRGAPRLDVLAGARAVRPVDHRGREPRGPGHRLLRRPQHHGAREEARLPARGVPALDRAPRGHPPGPVHRRALAAGAFPVTRERDARCRRPRPRDPQGRGEAHPRGTSRRRGPDGRRGPARAAGNARTAGGPQPRVGDDEPARGPRRHHDGSGRSRPGPERRALRRDAAGPPQFGAAASHGCCRR